MGIERRVKITEMGIQRQTRIKHMCGHWVSYVGTSPTYSVAVNDGYTAWLDNELTLDCANCRKKADLTLVHCEDCQWDGTITREQYDDAMTRCPVCGFDSLVSPIH